MAETERGVSGLYRFFRSMRLAIVLILYLIVVSIIATIIPQGRDSIIYAERYGSMLASVITVTGFDHLFTSLTFLAPLGLFFLNLCTCTYYRFTKRIRRGLKKRFGPDILHLGLLLLLVSGVVVALTSDKADVTMATGDEIGLPGGYILRLEGFELLSYDDGRPRDWISTVSLRRGEETIRDRFAIEVNRPLRAGGMRIYQYSHGEDSGLIISDPDGQAYRVRPGQTIPTESGDYLVVEVVPVDVPGDGFRAAVDIQAADGRTLRSILAAGDSVGPYFVNEVFLVEVTGLRIETGSGRIGVLVALMMIAAGLGLTYIQKIGDDQL